MYDGIPKCGAEYMTQNNIGYLQNVKQSLKNN